MAYVKVFAGIRHNLVERTLVNGFGMSEYFKNHSYTLLPSWKEIDPDNTVSSLPCRQISDIKVAGDMAIEFMDRKGFDFLNHYKSLKALDHVFNDLPKVSAKWTKHSYLRCFRAMTIAKLMDRQDYDRLFQMHRQYLEKRGFGGAIINRFDTTFARLKRFSLN